MLQFHLGSKKESDWCTKECSERKCCQHLSSEKDLKMTKDLPTLKWNSKSVGLAPNHLPKSRETWPSAPRKVDFNLHTLDCCANAHWKALLVLEDKRAFGVLWSCNVCIDLYCPFLVMIASAYLPLRRGSLLWKKYSLHAKSTGKG